MKDKIKKAIASVFELQEEMVGDDFSQKNFAAWDSLKHLMLISELEAEFNVALEPEEMEMMKSVEKISEVLQHKIKA